MSCTIYYEKDADLSVLKDKTICVIGYGSQGRAHSNNLHDSGCKVTVGLREGSSTFDAVKADGPTPMEMTAAVKQADVICFLCPDAIQAKVYNEVVAPNMKKGVCLLFAHGFNIHYNQIQPPADADVIMVAPKGPGNMVRELYTNGEGVPGLLAIHQDATGNSKAIGLAYALGIGCARAGVIETSFQEETETDLFGEQAVLCGGCAALIKTGFEVLVEAGYSPEMAYFECCNELKLIVDLIYRGGLKHMREFISETAKWGDITRGPRVIDEHVRENMWEVLTEIQTGEFATEFILENQANRPTYNALLRMEGEHEIEEVGDKLRSLMKWLG